MAIISWSKHKVTHKYSAGGWGARLGGGGFRWYMCKSPQATVKETTTRTKQLVYHQLLGVVRVFAIIKTPKQ